MFSSLKFILLFIAFMMLLKAIYPILNRLTKYKEQNYNFSLKVKKENINKLSRFEFEGFCKWLFDGNSNILSIEDPYSDLSSGADFILNTLDSEKIYVKCKRNIKEDTLTIGLDPCQSLVGAMVSDNVKEGIIITIGFVSEAAKDYIKSINSNTDFTLTIIDMEGISRLLEAKENSEDYEINVTI